MEVEVLSPARRLVQVKAQSVTVPGVMGYMTILPGHAELISEDSEKRLWINFNRRRWKRREPFDDEWEHEEPRLLRRGLKLVLNNGALTADDLSARLHISVGDIETLTGLPSGYLESGFARVQMISHRPDRNPIDPNQPRKSVV